MEIFEVAHAVNPQTGKIVKALLTQEETTVLLQIGLSVLLQEGLAKFTTEKDGVNIKDLSTTQGSA
jgi:hypothetical protein